MTANVNNLAVNQLCQIFDEASRFGSNLVAFGYTYIVRNFSFANGKSLSSNCALSIDNSNAAHLTVTQKTFGTCSVSFDMVYPLTGSYTGTNPSSDIIYQPLITSFFFAGNFFFVDQTVVTNPITIPSEPARTCSLIHPNVVKMVNTKPSDFPSFSSLVEAGSFSVTLSCPPTTSARSGTPRLIFSYPSASLLNVCVATNQADPAVASPVTVVITRRINNNIICGDSAIGPSPDQNFASFNGSGAYTSTLDYKTLYFSQAANPAPGPFTTSVTLQVSYP